MFRRLKYSISKPGIVFAFAKDKAFQLIKHLLLMMFLMAIPVFITAYKNPAGLLPDTSIVADGVRQKFIQHDFEIVNHELINPNNITTGFISREYVFYIGDSIDVDATGIIVQLRTSDIHIYANVNGFMKQEYKTITYEEAGITNLEFNATTANAVAYEIINVMANQSLIVTMQVTQYVFANMIEYLFIALVLALLFKMSHSRGLPFKHSFKISFYLTSIWAIITLLLALFDLSHLGFIALIGVYIYHIWAYRQIMIVQKVAGQNKNNNKKRDDQKDE